MCLYQTAGYYILASEVGALKAGGVKEGEAEAGDSRQEVVEGRGVAVSRAIAEDFRGCSSRHQLFSFFTFPDTIANSP